MKRLTKKEKEYRENYDKWVNDILKEQEEETFHIQLNKERLKKAFKGVLLMVGIFFIVFIAIKILVPMALGLLDGLLFSLELYHQITDINFKFIGWIFFLFIGFKIFEVVFNIFIQIYLVFFEELSIVLKKDSRIKSEGETNDN